MTKATKKFSLKDQLFNARKVAYLAALIAKAFPGFDRPGFEQQVLAEFPSLELKQRISHMAQALRDFLPQSFDAAADVLLASLPAELDPSKTDDDFGDFIFAPFSEFIARNGCSEAHFERSLAALGEITKRFSAEDAIRTFINAFPEKTFAAMLSLARSTNYHQRRLASEGSRPNLPWSQKIHWKPQQIIQILEHLYADSTRFVTRSVANNLNDISKIEPELVLTTLDRWETSGRQDSKEMAFIVKHALRTLLKRGHRDALCKLGFFEADHVTLASLQVADQVRLGSELPFSFSLCSQRRPLGKLRLEYAVYYLKANGSQRPKVFKLTEADYAERERGFQKKHPFKAITTRAHYPGVHALGIIVNGKELDRVSFALVL